MRQLLAARVPILALAALLLSPISQAQSGATTLAAETGNNTAACSGPNDPLGNHTYCTGNLIGFATTSTNSHAQTQLVDSIPGHMSHLPLSTWLPSEPSTKFIAAYQPWFCTTGPGGPYNGTQTCTNSQAGDHKIIGYDESTAQVVAAQHQQMINLGYWAVSPDWYGTNQQANGFLNNTVQVEADDLNNRPGYPLKLLIMIDQGAILSGTQTLLGCPRNSQDQTTCIIQNLEADTDYIDQHWAETPYYAQDTVTGANLVSVFISECSWPSVVSDCPNNPGPTNWDTIWQAVTQHAATYSTPMEFVKEYGNFNTNPDPNPFITSYFSGAYAWPQIAGNSSGTQFYVDGNNGGWTYPAIPTVPGDCSTGSNVPGCMQFYWNQTAAPQGAPTSTWLISITPLRPIPPKSHLGNCSRDSIGRMLHGDLQRK